MKVLMDTHALLWAVSGDRKLCEKAAETFIDPETDLFFSMAGYWEICIKVLLNLPYHHRDPFDRLLIAQASVEEMTIMTKNAAFGKYRIPILW